MELSAYLQGTLAHIKTTALEPLFKLCFEYWKHGNKTVPLVVLALAAGFWLGRKRALFENSFQKRIMQVAAFQNQGEALVARTLLQNFPPPNYHLLNHITLQMADGTTQIDHILVSRFGIFVIETKHYRGWLLVNPNQARWTQILFGQRYNFYNPLRQNVRHVRAVADLLDFMPSQNIKPVVVFSNDAEFQTEIPAGVFNLQGMIDYIGTQTLEIISLNQMQFCVGRLETTRLAITSKTDVEHVEEVRRKLGNFQDLP